MQKKIYLELIRGVAAILVVVTHLVLLHPSLNTGRFNIISNWGTESVMIFFILSGIVINISQKIRPKTIGSFLKNRIKRLYPQLFAGILLGLLVMLFLNLPLVTSKVIVGNFLMLSTLQGYIVSSLYSNNPIWSLTFEMSFYLIFAFTMIGKMRRNLMIWSLISLLAIPLYYFPSGNGVLDQITAVLSFSSIWLIGYAIFEYRLFFYFDIYVALISLGLLPLVARLDLTGQYYDPIKFLLFAFVSVPFFHYCLQEKREGKKICIYYFLAVYAALIFLIIIRSKSLVTSKIIYCGLPILFVTLYSFIKRFNGVKKIKNLLRIVGLVTGKYSFSIYIIHYPILFLFAHLCKNPFVYLTCGLFTIFLSAYFLENIYQNQIIKLITMVKDKILGYARKNNCKYHSPFDKRNA